MSNEIIDSMAQNLVQSRAPSTVSKYMYEIKHYKEFFINRNLPYEPAYPIHVAMYLSHMIDIGKSSGVVSATYYGIKWFHDINGYDDPTSNALVTNMLESAKRNNSKPVTKMDTIDTEDLIALCDRYSCSTNVIDLRDLSMILIAYSGFLRFNEISELKCSDVKFYDKYMIIFIRKSKTDIYRSVSEVMVSIGNTYACPVSMLRKYMLFANLQSGTETYLFQPAFGCGNKCFLLNKNKKLSYTRARECIVGKLKLVAPDKKLGTHSLRASGATTASNADSNVNERCIKHQGRWKTDVAKDMYINDSVQKKLMVSQSLKL